MSDSATARPMQIHGEVMTPASRSHQTTITGSTATAVVAMAT